MLRVAPSDRRNFVRGRQTRAVDALRRRVTKNDQRFVYDGYLQIADNAGNAYVWDVTEPVATRPLVWTKNDISSYYDFDGNKNVSEVLASDGSLAAHYEYAPFGALTVSRGTSAATNPWRFSSEYAEDDTATVYYNYRHYEPVMGRWLQRDPIEEEGGVLVYSFLENALGLYVDRLGRFPILPIFAAALKSAIIEAVKGTALSLIPSWYDKIRDEGALVFDANFTGCGTDGLKENDIDGFHDIKLIRSTDSSVLAKSLQEGLKKGSAAFISQFAAGSLDKIIRNHASKFLNPDSKSVYYEYYKKIEKLITKEGAEELTDAMVDRISKFAVEKIGDVSSLIANLKVVSDEKKKIRWEVEDKCRICAIIKESFTVSMTVMGEKQPSFQIEGPEQKLRCFDYEKLGDYGSVGRGARKRCGICPCQKE